MLELLDPQISEKNNQLKLLYNLSKLPKDLSITTISFTFDMDIEFYVKEISDYYQLSYNGVTTLKYCVSNKIYVKSLYPDKYITKRKKASPKKKKTFSNQVTLIIDKNDINNNANDTNIKLFNNGAVQVSGCFSYEHFIKSISLVFNELKKDKFAWEKVADTMNPKSLKYTFVPKPFTNNKNLCISNINNYKLNLINTGFKLGFKVDRDKLHKLLLSKNIACSYEPSIYAGVSITHIYKYKTFTKNISIIVFEKGYIIINGGLYKNQIISAYRFINNIIYENYNSIVQWSIFDFIRK